MTESINVGYRSLADNVLRPYLVLDVTGPNGITRRIIGIVDSGADRSCFPKGFITEFGYDPTGLTAQVMTQAGGTTTSYVATANCSAVVVDLENTTFSLAPTFVDGSYVLWGRTDFMNTFDITLLQSQNRFTVSTH